MCRQWLLDGWNSVPKALSDKIYPKIMASFSSKGKVNQCSMRLTAAALFAIAA